jgi:hypothetical protein
MSRARCGCRSGAPANIARPGIARRRDAA